MKKYMAFILFTFIMGSCKQTNKSHSDPNTVIIPAEPNKFVKRDDCYKDRKTEKLVGQKTARITYSGDVGLLDCYELGYIYQPCELPSWAEEGMEVIFSGVAKEVFENEQPKGIPFRISEIDKKE